MSDHMNITIKTFQSGGKTITIDPPLSMEVDKTMFGNFTAECYDINLFDVDPTIAGLRQGLLNDLDALWQEYAKEADDNLTPKALELKQQLLRRMKETT